MINFNLSDKTYLKVLAKLHKLYIKYLKEKSINLFY